MNYMNSESYEDLPASLLTEHQVVFTKKQSHVTNCPAMWSSEKVRELQRAIQTVDIQSPKFIQ